MKRIDILFLVGTLIAIGGLCICPPWIFDNGPYTVAMGHSVVWAPPDLSRLYMGMIAMEAIGLLALSSAAWLLARCYVRRAQFKTKREQKR